METKWYKSTQRQFRVWELEWISAVCAHSGKGEWREGHRLFGMLSHSDASLSTDTIHGLPLWGMQKQGGHTHRILCRTRTQPKVGHIIGLHRTIVATWSVPCSWLVEGRSKCRHAHHFRGSSSPAKVEGLDFWFGFSVVSSEDCLPETLCNSSLPFVPPAGASLYSPSPNPS